MLFVTFIPIRFNDGTDVPEEELRDILDGFEARFGGATVDGPKRGQWHDPRTGTMHVDDVMQVSVSTLRERVGEARDYVREIGKRLKQQTMYFEVRYYDGVEIIPTDNN